MYLRIMCVIAGKRFANNGSPTLETNNDNIYTEKVLSNYGYNSRPKTER
jgi:hypothetical protein